MRLLNVLLLLSALLIGTVAVNAADQSVEQETVWIDVRSWAENQFDSIDGDLHIPYQDIVIGVSEKFPHKDTPIRLYCAKGGRAGKALDQLSAAGYTDIQNAGGIDDVRAKRFAPSEAEITQPAQ